MTDQAVVPERLLDRSLADRGPRQKPLCQFQVKNIQRCIRPEALLVADPTVGLLALVDDLLKFPRHMVVDTAQEFVAGDHYGFRSDRDIEREHFDPGHPQPIAAA